jgi:hypothetical protein
MKENAILFWALVLASASPTFARIGETLDECQQRYGSATGDVSASDITFRRDSVIIVIHFRRGKSFQEDFAPESGARLNEAQIKQFLDENAEGSTWEANGETAGETDVQTESYFCDVPQLSPTFLVTATLAFLRL